VLVCLQSLDAGGKDGTIRHVMSGVNPQGVHVSSFKVPSAEELDHDYLWRYACRLPARGEIGIFNRSHYEEVLVVRVHPQLVDRQKLPKEVKDHGLWRRRYRDINNWERYLTDNGIAVVKLFLNLSKEEQRRRFLARIDRPEKNWKFSANDANERRYWDDYQKAFSQTLSETSTKWAPWYVVPADRKWFARLCVSAILAHTLIELDPRYPVLSDDSRAQLLVARDALEAEAPEGSGSRSSARPLGNGRGTSSAQIDWLTPAAAQS
jgi:PPK2 family polyphosphate:nucleotide phosphotransferase